VEILAKDDMPVGIAVDDQNVYWASTNHWDAQIRRCPKSGCNGAPIVMAEHQDWIWGVLVHGDDVYWAVYETGPGAAGKVLSCKKTGCVGAPTVIADGQSHPTWLRATDTDLYWLVDGAIMSRPFAGGAAPKVVANGMAVAGATTFAVDAAHGLVFWGSADGLWGCSLAGCAPTQLSPPFAQALAGDGQRAYYLGDDELGSCEAGVCSPLLSVNLPVCSQHALLVVDDASAYFSSCGPVTKCPKVGACKPVTLSKGLTGTGDLAVDATHDYFTDYGVFRVAK